MNLSKNDFRAKASHSIRNLTEEERGAFNNAICKKLLSMQEFNSAQSIMAYYPLTDEVDIKPVLTEIIDKGKTLFLPKVNTHTTAMNIYKVSDLVADLTKGPMSLIEPCSELQTVNPDTVDFVIVPGRAFTVKGKRLGRGKGYYDRFLAGLSKITVAAASYSCQVFDEIPVDPHDKNIDILVTEENLIFC